MHVNHLRGDILSNSIKQQVLAHLEEQERERQAKVAAAKAAEEAKKKEEADDLSRFMEACRNVIEPAMREFATFLEDRIFQGKVEVSLGNQGNPNITFEFFSDLNPRPASALYRRAGQLGMAETVTVMSNTRPEIRQVRLSDVTNESVQEHLLGILRKLKA